MKSDDDHPWSERGRLNFTWLLKLRWVAAGGQLITVLLVDGALGIRLSLVPLVGLVAVLAATNLALEIWFRRDTSLSRWRDWQDGGENLIGSIMIVDVMFLTAMLQVSGGPTNPFVVFYIANIVLGSVMLGTGWAWLLLALSLVGYVVIYLWHRPIAELELHESNGDLLEPLRLLFVGSFIAFSAAAIITAWFVTRLSKGLRRREEELERVRQKKAEADRLEALATLAGGAAHELASPLSTIAVVARELQRDLQRDLEAGAPVADAIEDARLIRGQVDRCRDILDHMASDAGNAMGEVPRPISVAEIVSNAIRGIAAADRVHIEMDAGVRERTVEGPPRALARAVRSIVKNAIDASPPDRDVSLSVRDEGHLVVIVEDHGAGMPKAVAARATDPFFTTKEPGSGMGLGLFLTQTVLDRIGGTFDIDSIEGRGTTVKITLPVSS